MRRYDATDLAILAALRKDSAQRLLTYATNTGIPKSTLHERLHKLLRSGVRCVPLVRWDKLGYPISVVFFVPHEPRLAEHPCVNNAQHVAPNLLMLECVFASMKDVEEFKELLKAARYFTVVETLKREGFVP